MAVTTQAEYEKLLKQLLPPGPAWPRGDAASLMAMMIEVWAAELSRVDSRARSLVKEADPRFAIETFDEWLEDWGLPDACTQAWADINTSILRTLLIYKVRTIGRQDRQYFVDLAAMFGYRIVIDEFRQHTVISTSMDALCEEPWPYTWRVNVLESAGGVMTLPQGERPGFRGARVVGRQADRVPHQEVRPGAHEFVLRLLRHGERVMDRIYLSKAAQTPPETPEDVDPGYPTDGSSSSGTDATVPGAYWYYAVAEELANAIKGGGVTPDRHDLSQLNKAIDARISKAVNDRIAAINSLQAKVAQVEVVPTGMIMFFPQSWTPNGNWLVCNGQNVSRSTYANLFRLIGTKYGNGNGSTTFGLPNLIDRVVWGGQWNAGEYRNPGLPNITGSLTIAEVARSAAMIRGVSGAFTHTGAYRGDQGQAGDDTESWSDRIDFNANRNSWIYGNSNTVQPPALVLLPCIHI